MKEGIIASLFWASNIVLIKLFLNQYDASTLAMLKAFLSSCLLFIFKKDKLKIDKSIFMLIIAGFFTVFLNYKFSYQAYKDVTLVDICFYNVLTLVLLKKKVDLKNILIIIAMLLNVEFNLLLLLSMLSYIAGLRIASKVDMNYLPKTMVMLLFGSLFFIPNIKMIHFTMIHMILFLLISVIGYGYIMSVYNMNAQNKYLNLHPVLTYVIAVLVLKEPFNLIEFIGILVVLFSII